MYGMDSDIFATDNFHSMSPAGERDAKKTLQGRKRRATIFPVHIPLYISLLPPRVPTFATARERSGVVGTRRGLVKTNR